MTTSIKTNIGQSFMHVARLLQGREPIASTILSNALGDTIHIMALADYECISFVKHLKGEKFIIKHSEIIQGKSHFSDVSLHQESLSAVKQRAIKEGFINEVKRQKPLPIVQLGFNLNERAA